MTPHADGGPSIVGDVSSFPPDAEYARTLVAAQRRGHLATLTADGSPFGSVVSYVDDIRGRPVVCISAMAEHTINATRSPDSSTRRQLARRASTATASRCGSRHSGAA